MARTKQVVPREPQVQVQDDEGAAESGETTTPKKQKTTVLQRVKYQWETVAVHPVNGIDLGRLRPKEEEFEVNEPVAQEQVQDTTGDFDDNGVEVSDHVFSTSKDYHTPPGLHLPRRKVE